jgi:hypothetical protein
MTEAELHEIAALFSTGAMTALSIYLSVISAFLVVAFVVGSKLTRSQLIIVSTLFVLGALFFTYGTAGFFIRQIPIVERLAALHPDQHYAVYPASVMAIAAIQVLGILACLKFMWDVRHPKTE